MSDTFNVRPDTPQEENPEWTSEDLKKAEKAPDYFGRERCCLLSVAYDRRRKGKVDDAIRSRSRRSGRRQSDGKGVADAVLNQELRRALFGKKVSRLRPFADGLPETDELLIFSMRRLDDPHRTGGNFATPHQLPVQDSRSESSFSASTSASLAEPPQH